ncbi:MULTISPECIES: ThiF family adenylyltransferase [unclassified Iodidimonas]|jgi:molybdopterin/thiamine biosynthesis adenylyltransferase|uniref:ThiF family adenylyltransferase n=1 Tax=unclassified Iodidimonas TaxID=2626145 RepID=UPI0024832AFA|nr:MULTISPECIES: ThiF family adenylyltransferase [unclassified Iodidimonas]
MDQNFDYDTAFSRTLGWITHTEQQILKGKRVAIAGLGGVGGGHALMLARLGIGAFHIADFDRFDLANMNRQAGAFVSTITKPKCAVIKSMLLDINPEAEIKDFPQGVDDRNLDAFLEDVDLFIDGLDFFVLDIRRALFARARALAIPAITVAPLGLGASLLTFMPDSLSFDRYFRFSSIKTDEASRQNETAAQTKNYVRFMIGLAPAALHRSALVDQSHVDFSRKAGPSTPMACGMASALLGAEAMKILLKRGRIKPAPFVHQYDPYQQRLRTTWTAGGNANPWRRVKIELARHWIEKLIAKGPQNHLADSVAADAPRLHQILDQARWAPSGDNEQPWRFEILDENSLRIHLIYHPGSNFYEYAHGRPILLAAGGLLETIRIAASHHGLSIEWTLDENANPWAIHVTFHEADVSPDRLMPFIKSRTVDRRPYRKIGLDAKEMARLEQTLPKGGRIIWFQSPKARWAMTRLNMKATLLRLTIPEAHRVHQKAVNFSTDHSPWGMPAQSVGLDPLTVRLMRWANAKWSRTKILNRLLGGAWAASLQLDILPGMNCAAHFALCWDQDKAERPDQDWIMAGQHMQRFWLTAHAMGLSIQPSYAPLIFTHGASHDQRWSESRTDIKAKAIGQFFDSVMACSSDAVIFPGRIGRSRRPVTSRSVRQPLSSLFYEKE